MQSISRNWWRICISALWTERCPAIVHSLHSQAKSRAVQPVITLTMEPGVWSRGTVQANLCINQTLRDSATEKTSSTDSRWFHFSFRNILNLNNSSLRWHFTPLWGFVYTVWSRCVHKLRVLTLDTQAEITPYVLPRALYLLSAVIFECANSMCTI